IEGSVPAGGADTAAGASQAAAGPGETETPPAAAPAPRQGLRAAAQALLDACDADCLIKGPIHDAMEGLPPALPGQPAKEPRDPPAPRAPREGTKQEAVLAMLRAEGGTTVAAIGEATGWQAHTVRGFFAGLKKKGIEVHSAKTAGADGKAQPTVYSL